MSLLERYKKPGGFNQLLTLLETCGPAKKEKFLKMISEESLDWFNALKTRILSLEIILNWPQEYITELTSRAQPITIAAISKGSLSEEQIKKLIHGLSHGQLAKIREISENKNFTTNEISSSVEKFLGEVRTHIAHGVIKLEKFAPDLVVSSEIEELLAKKGIPSNSIEKSSLRPESEIDTSSTDLHSVSSTVHSRSGDDRNSGSSISASSALNHTTIFVGSDEMGQIKKINQQLTHEIQILKQENRILKDKLEKIRKIA